MTNLVETVETVVVNTESTSKVVVEEQTAVLLQDSITNTVLQSDTGNLVVSDVLQEVVISAGVQGPPGIPGASTQFEYHVSGVVLGGNRAVTINSAGQIAYPDLTTNTSFVVGISTTSASIGDLATIQISGTQTEPAWSWTPGAPVFASTNGVLTQTPPATGQVLCIGYAVTPTKIIIDKQPPIFME